MPKVSPEHSEARRQQILTAARTCFLRDGFHQTSMLDIQREANLSAGAIYLYFKGKREIVLGIASDILGTVSDLFPDPAAIAAAGHDYTDLVVLMLREAEAMNRGTGIFRLGLLVWAEAIRDPELLLAIRDSVNATVDRLEALVIACQAVGLVDDQANPRGIALATLGLAQGFAVQHSLIDPDILETYALGVRALLQISGGERCAAPVGEAT